MDRRGKDSYRHRDAGAEEVIVVASGRWALLREDSHEPCLSDLVRRKARVDVILVEWFKARDIPEVEVYRPSLGKPPLYPIHAGTLAVATDAPAQIAGRQVLDLNAPQEVVEAILSVCMYPLTDTTLTGSLATK